MQLTEKFIYRYGQYIPKAPFKFPSMTGVALQKAIKDMGPAAGGLDGWSYAELRTLPLQIWQLRAKVVNLQEQIGKTPTSQKAL